MRSLSQRERLSRNVDTSYNELNTSLLSEMIEIAENDTFIFFPRTVNCSAIWEANSRVGVNTSEWKADGSAANDWRIGITKQRVFPDPVGAAPMTSLPSGELK